MSISQQLSMTAVVFIFLSLSLFILADLAYENKLKYWDTLAWVGALFMASTPLLFLSAIWV